MTLLRELELRCESKCEICGSKSNLSAYLVPPKVEEKTENQVAICELCNSQISDKSTCNSNHWRSLTESIWSQIPSVQVLSYKMLQHFSGEAWAQDTLGMIFLDEGTLEWADSVSNSVIVHKDSNGNILNSGDTVTLIQDLNVKGGGFTAKRGTAVRRIRLVIDNEEHIEGKIDGQLIVILTKYVKKS